MAQKTLTFNFSQGLDLKDDPYQIPFGQFQSLRNSTFITGQSMVKRYGYKPLSDAPYASAHLTTLNGNLISIGKTISFDAQSVEKVITNGIELQPCTLEVTPVVRNNYNQLQCDSTITNGLVCTVFTQSLGNGVVAYKAQISDLLTGQIIVAPFAVPPLATGSISGSSRVFVLGDFFVIVSQVTVSSVNYLQYFTISTLDPLVVSVAQNVYPEAYTALSSNPGWDAVVTSGSLVVAYNTLAGGQAIHVTVLTVQQITSNQASGLVKSFTNAAYKAGIMSVCVDSTVNPSYVYVTFWNPTNSNTYTLCVYTSFGTINTVFNPTLIGNANVANISTAAQNNLCNIYLEKVNNYGYDALVPTNFVSLSAISSRATVTGGAPLIRGIGLASKAFVVAGEVFFMAAYQSTYQDSYFVINATQTDYQSNILSNAISIVVAKLAYTNGGGYLALGLPSVYVNGNDIAVSYLFKQNVQALNTTNTPTQTTSGGIYSQLGINLAQIQMGTNNIATIEAAQDLHLTGGFLGMYDGSYPVEHNFFLFPDNIEAVYMDPAQVSSTGTFTSGSTTVTISSASGVYQGMRVVDITNPTYFQSGTFVAFINGTTVTITKPTTAAGTGDLLTFSGNVVAKPDGTTNTNAYFTNPYFYQATYEWTDSKGNAYRSQPSIPISVTTTGTGTLGIITVNVPTLRVTQKVGSAPAKIVIYRWSAKTQVYNQVTSVLNPIVNNTSVDYITFVDTYSDDSIVGNNLIYTTGGVVPDFNAPATSIMTLFDTRLCIVDAENQDSILVSKTIIDNTPVEMSSLFRLYVSPTIGIAASSGPITALAPMDDKLIIFKSNAIFYINGTGPDNLGTTSPGCSLGNYSQPIFITSTVGCINDKSIVLIPNGLMFSTNKGIWRLKRDLTIDYIGAPVEDFNVYAVTSAKAIPGTNFVLFTLSDGTILMHDYYVSQWGEWHGVGPVISSCIYNGKHTSLTSYGKIVTQTPGYYEDGNNPVLISFVSGWLNLATLQGYQRFYELYFLATFLSPHKIQCLFAYDYNASNLHSFTIVPKNFSPATPGPFGIPTPFGSPSALEQWRVHAKKQLCQSFQVTMQEVFDGSYGTDPGAGFTLTGIACKVDIKKATRPIAGANSVG